MEAWRLKMEPWRVCRPVFASLWSRIRIKWKEGSESVSHDFAWDSSGKYCKIQLKRGKEELNLDNKNKKYTHFIIPILFWILSRDPGARSLQHVTKRVTRVPYIVIFGLDFLLNTWGWQCQQKRDRCTALSLQSDWILSSSENIDLFRNSWFRMLSNPLFFQILDIM